jgi:hypothetical protein
MAIKPRVGERDIEKVISSTTLHAAIDLWSQSGEQHYLPIQGKSMLPLLRESDEVLVVHTRELHPGEIAVFQQPGGLFAHRVLHVFGEGVNLSLRAKGDNTLGLDPPVFTSAIVGKAAALRRAGKILDLNTPGWRRMGRVMAALGKAQASVYYHTGDITPEKELPPPTKLSTWISRVILRGNALLLRLCLGIIGRWHAES